MLLLFLRNVARFLLLSVPHFRSAKVFNKRRCCCYEWRGSSPYTLIDYINYIRCLLFLLTLMLILTTLDCALILRNYAPQTILPTKQIRSRWNVTSPWHSVATIQPLNYSNTLESLNCLISVSRQRALWQEGVIAAETRYGCGNVQSISR